MRIVATTTSREGRVTHHLVREESGSAAYVRLRPLLPVGSETRRPHPGHRHVDRARRLSTRDELGPGTVSRKRARARRKLTRSGRVHHQPGRVAFGVPLHAPR